MKCEFGSILEKWFTAPEYARAAGRMLYSSERTPSRFLDQRFLPLMHAAERLIQGAKGVTIIDDEAYQSLRIAIKNVIPAGTPKELVDAFTNSLGYANGRNLNQKLMSVLNELADETCSLFCVDKAKFVKGIVDTRNHLTHYSTKKGKLVLQGLELHWASRKLVLMLRVLLLVGAGIPEATIQRLVQRQIRLSGERRVWSELSEEGTAYGGFDLEEVGDEIE